MRNQRNCQGFWRHVRAQRIDSYVEAHNLGQLVPIAVKLNDTQRGIVHAVTLAADEPIRRVVHGSDDASQRVANRQQIAGAAVSESQSRSKRLLLAHHTVQWIINHRVNTVGIGRRQLIVVQVIREGQKVDRRRTFYTFYLVIGHSSFVID